MKESRKDSAAAIIRNAAAKWPTTIVARSQVRSFSGGVYSPRYLANKDSEGTGPIGAFRIGRQTCYPVESLVEWLVDRLAV